ncbi:MAG: carbohydrate kinase, partial [Muribaculaceae bacterium]|nr:carbohydrate kinase [Muribaculaceae bacterium]
MKKGVVVGIGEVLWDIFPGGKQLGGAPANFAFHVMKQGVQSCVVSAVGNDKLGDEIVDALQCKGLQLNISRVMQSTGTVNVEIDDNGVPCY